MHVAACNGDAGLIAHLLDMGGKQQQQHRRRELQRDTASTNTSTNTSTSPGADGEEEKKVVEEEGAGDCGFSYYAALPAHGRRLRH